MGRVRKKKRKLFVPVKFVYALIDFVVVNILYDICCLLYSYGFCGSFHTIIYFMEDKSRGYWSNVNFYWNSASSGMLLLSSKFSSCGRNRGLGRILERCEQRFLALLLFAYCTDSRSYLFERSGYVECKFHSLFDRKYFKTTCVHFRIKV